MASAAVATAVAQAKIKTPGSTLDGQTANDNGTVQAPSLVDRHCLINFERAYDVMNEHNVDGIVALNPLNMFYLGNHLGYKSKMGSQYPGFAIMSRNEKKPVLLVLSVVDQWHIANQERDYPDIIAYTGPVNWYKYQGKPERWKQTPTAAGGIQWVIYSDTLSARESGWLAMDESQTGKYSASSGWGLVEALRESGLSQARIAVDDMRIANVLGQLGMEDVRCVDGDNLFRKIRMLKSPVEIKFMRVAAIANQTAIHNTLKQVLPGATASDIEYIFRIESAKLGAEMEFFSVGTYGGLRNGEIVKSEPLMIDGVSKINNYCGDYGRTFVYGSPSLRVEQRVTQLDAARQAVFDMLKPGVRYSDIQAVAKKAMAGRGLPSDVIARATPHSVGMTHTDEALRDGLPFAVKDDLMLHEGMVITVDLPCYELGRGSTHLEDVTLITRDGCEILATADSPIIVGS